MVASVCLWALSQASLCLDIEHSNHLSRCEERLTTKRFANLTRIVFTATDSYLIDIITRFFCRLRQQGMRERSPRRFILSVCLYCETSCSTINREDNSQLSNIMFLVRLRVSFVIASLQLARQRLQPTVPSIELSKSKPSLK